MKNDIVFPKVKGVAIAIARTEVSDEEFDWAAYLINNNEFTLTNVIVATKGYGHQDGEPQRTSILRHIIGTVKPNSFVTIERIDPTVFHLVNEYWLSYYVEDRPEIYDKKFLFLPESIIENNVGYIPQLERKGVLHE